VSAIKANDLVYVLRDCCSDDQIGVPFKVIEVYELPATCSRCGGTFDGPVAHLGYQDDGPEPWGRPLSWLKKIEGDAQPEDVQREETVHA
jgi:hypothetical protein